LFVLFFVPFVVWDQSFVTDRFDFITASGGRTTTILLFKSIALAAIILVGGLIILANYSPAQAKEPAADYRVAQNFFILYFLLYILLSFLVTGIFVHPLEQYLYVLNFIAILVMLPRVKGTFDSSTVVPVRWAQLTFILIIVLGILALIAANAHGPLRGSQIRF
jgi:hypothetical protein